MYFQISRWSILKKILLRIDCKYAKDVLQKDVKNLVSKQIFARWQAILSSFDFEIEFIKVENNSLPYFLSREYLQGQSEKKHFMQNLQWAVRTKAKGYNWPVTTNSLLHKIPHKWQITLMSLYFSTFVTMNSTIPRSMD